MENHPKQTNMFGMKKAEAPHNEHFQFSNKGEMEIET